MLIGRFEAKLDDKTRIAFPRKFREILGDELIITYGFEGSLIIVGKDRWEMLFADIDKQPFTRAIAREMKRYLLGGANMINLDAKSRFILPVYLKDHAKIIQDAIFLGLTHYVELWDKAIFQTHHTDIQKSISFISERLQEDKNE